MPGCYDTYAMSYDASLEFKKDAPVVDLMRSLTDKFGLDDIRITDKGRRTCVRFDFPYSRLDEDSFLDELNTLKDWIVYGCISFTTEDTMSMESGMFRFVFDVEKSKWNRETAELLWPSERKPHLTHSNRLELLGCLAEAVEDLLEEKGISIPNPEKEDDENAAIIYGSDYGILTSAFENILVHSGLLEKEE